MRRTRSVGTKVTDDEYAKLEHLAAGQTLSEWVRDVLLATVTPRPADQVILAEFLAICRGKSGALDRIRNPLPVEQRNAFDPLHHIELRSVDMIGHQAGVG